MSGFHKSLRQIARLVFDSTYNFLRTSLISNGEEIDVQNPLPCDGDSVYVKDLDLTYCDNYNFSGDVTDYFDSLKTVNTDATTNNPKQIKLWFKRTVYAHAIGFGCDDITKGFGNSITIKLLGSGEEVRFSKIFIPSNPNSFLAEFGPKAFNGVIFEFNTATEVCLSNVTIRKSLETSSTIQGQTPAGEIKEVNVTQDGDLSISNNSSGLAIAEGNVTGKTFIHKFGKAPDFDTGDGVVTVWDGADDNDINQMQYVYSTTAAIDSVSSSSTSDTFDIEIQGLDGDYALVNQTVTLNGQNRVALTTNLLRVFRMKNVNSIDNVGHIYCFENVALSLGVPTDSTKVRAVIQPTKNQTLMAVFTIEADKTGYMRDWFASIAGASKSSNYIVELRARPLGGVFQLKHESALEDGGTSYIQHKYEEPEKFEEKTDIEMRVSLTEAGATGAAFSGGFDIVLVEN